MLNLLSLGNSGSFAGSPNVQTGTTYTVLPSDYGRIVTFNNASAITVTLPQQSTNATFAGFWFQYQNIGAGTVTFVKEGSETFTPASNTTAATGASGIIWRNTTTNWNNFGGTAIKNMPNLAPVDVNITTSNTIVLSGYVGTTTTLLGIYQKCRALTTAGTFAIKKNGTSLTGLESVVPSTAGSYVTCTGTGADNVLVRGDQITIVADGSLVLVLDLNITPDITLGF